LRDCCRGSNVRRRHHSSTDIRTTQRQGGATDAKHSAVGRRGFLQLGALAAGATAAFPQTLGSDLAAQRDRDRAPDDFNEATVPMGEIFGLPVGVSFIGTAFSEPMLIRVASGFEHGPDGADRAAVPRDHSARSRERHPVEPACPPFAAAAYRPPRDQRLAHAFAVA